MIEVLQQKDIVGEIEAFECSVVKIYIAHSLFP